MESYTLIRNELIQYNQGLQSVAEGLSRFTKSIETNTTANGKIYQQVKQLSENLLEINSISETVDDIAQQTGVLSINASIQAARAGEQGKAFAVVAGEVRKLSVQTQGHVQAITKTADRIVSSVSGILRGAEDANRFLDTMVSSNAEIHLETDRVVKEVQDSVRAMETGTQSIQAIHKYLDEIASREELVKFITQG
jgi:methyl-accepting chemotaxis protein